MSIGTNYRRGLVITTIKYDPLITAISRAVSAVVVVVIAAGNEGPVEYTINYLCLAQGVICVGAADTSRGNLSQAPRWQFSRRGVLFHSIYRFQMYQLLVFRIISSVPVNSSAAFCRTSMATPHISGVAALLKQVYPNWSPIDVKASIVMTASPVPISDIYENPNLLEQGSGMVRALEALTNPLRLSFPGGALQGFTQVLVMPPGSSGRVSLMVSSLANYSLGLVLIQRILLAIWDQVLLGK
jgi:subtilisin family serine protease